MLKVNKCITPSPKQWEIVVEGARNPMNSWDKMDSLFRIDVDDVDLDPQYVLGENDLSLLMRLRKAGTDHRKYLRMLPIHITITAPLYWWKEFDTYKVGTTTNSCSTMHKIHSKEFEYSDFSCDRLLHACSIDEFVYPNNLTACSPLDVLGVVIQALNHYRDLYLATNDKQYWEWMIQLLPTSYNQKRTISLNYENALSIYHARRNHKLTEWHTLCEFIETLPYAELITGVERYV